tara:strand:+ start:474 stop:1043 length:570 start_codon:yes stop_codon:yes gene_type:complete
MDNLIDFIYIEENTLSKDFCNHCIKKFENDDRKCIGVFNNGNSGMPVVDSTVKQSTDLYISSESDWNEENLTFDKSLSEHYESYVGKTFSEEYRNDFRARSKGFQIQRTEPGQFYRYHSDSYRDRLVTYIWYLNDIFEDGYTEFEFGLKVQPRTGKILLFPATWQYLHRGYPPKSETKYLCTGWLYFAS